MLDAARVGPRGARAQVERPGTRRDGPGRLVRLDRLLLEADRLRADARRKLEHEVERLEAILRISR
jgi:hypothetical protein